MKTIAQTVPNLFQSSRQEWVEAARRAAEDIILEEGQCTIEDVLARCPRPRYLHPNTTGHIFRNSIFRMLYVTRSRRPISNKRLICVWGLKEEFYPMSKLQYKRRKVEEDGRSD